VDKQLRIKKGGEQINAHRRLDLNWQIFLELRPPQ